MHAKMVDWTPLSNWLIRYKNPHIMPLMPFHFAIVIVEYLQNKIMKSVQNCMGGSRKFRKGEGSFLGTDVSLFPNFNNSVLTTRRNLLLHCWTHQYVIINPNFSAYVLQSIRLNGWFRGRVVNSWFWISYFLRSRLIWIYIVFKTGHYQAAW